MFWKRKQPKSRPRGDERRLERRRGKLERRRDDLTAEIEKAEERVHAINELFCNPGYFDKTPAAEVRKLEQEQKRLKASIDELMTEWETLERELEELSAPAA